MIAAGPPIALLTGVVAGALHVVSGPDHLAALAPLAARDRRLALRAGASWGLGHGVGVLAVGLAVLLARPWIDVAWLSEVSELVVGVLLVSIGAWSIRAALRIEVHAHDHDHDGAPHRHVHVHTGGTEHEAPDAHREHLHAAFGVGVLHGAAGTTHLLGVLSALALPVGSALAFLLGYLSAAVAAMALFGLAVGRLVGPGGTRRLRTAMAGAGVAAIGVGAWWVTASMGAL